MAVSVVKKERSLFLNLILYAIPIMLTGLLQLLYNTADQIVVGQFSGDPNALAAVGSSAALNGLIAGFCIGLTSGSNVIIARFIGAKNKDGVTNAVHTSMTFSLIIGLCVCALGLGVAKPMHLLLGTMPEVFDEALLYTLIIMAGVPAVSVYNFGAVVFRAANDSKTPFIILALTGLLNIGFNLFFVIVCGMGVEGVAIATIIAQYVSAIVVVILIMRLKDERKFSLSKMRIDKKILRQMLLIGIPSAVQGSLFAVSNMILQSSVNMLGASYKSASIVTGNTVGTTLESYTYILTNAFYHAAVTYVGQYYGARDVKNIKRTLLYTLIQSSTIGIVVSWIIIGLSGQLTMVFVNASEDNVTEVIKYASERIFVTQSLYFTVGVMEVFTGYLRAMGRSIIPMISSVFSICVIRILWAFFIFPIPTFYSLTGLFLIYPISWILCSILHFITILVVNKKSFAKRENEVNPKMDNTEIVA